MAAPQEAFTDLTFPVRGIDVAVGYDRQRPQTTPEGVNVRAFEPGSARARGGSRPGVAKYIDEILPPGHLTDRSGAVLADRSGRRLVPR